MCPTLIRIPDVTAATPVFDDLITFKKLGHKPKFNTGSETTFQVQLSTLQKYYDNVSWLKSKKVIHFIWFEPNILPHMETILTLKTIKEFILLKFFYFKGAI